MNISIASDNTLFNIVVKAMFGLVPSKVVFGIIPRLTIIPSDLSNQKERMEIIPKAQMEMNANIAERKISSALAL